MSKYFNFHVDQPRHKQVSEDVKSNGSLESEFYARSEATVSGNEGELSSSSSLGWSDEFSEEYDSSIRSKVYEELLLMDKILKGETTPPPQYDKDEYDQWMNRFPGLSVLDRCETPVNSPCFPPGKPNIVKHRLARKSFDIMSSQNHCDRQKLIMLNDFDTSINNVKSLKQYPQVYHKKVTPEFNDAYILESNRNLRICGVKSNINKKKSSGKTMNKLVPSLNIHSECDSLPFIKINHVSTRKLSSDYVNKKAWDILPKSLDCEDTDNNLVLPPIIMKNNFRSISATPRRSYKTFSAFSTKSNLLAKYTDRKQSSNCLSKQSFNN